MSVRANYIIDDIQSCIYTLLKTLSASTSPWTSWDVIRNYPEIDVFEKFTKPIIWVEPPTKTFDYYTQGSKAFHTWEMAIGAWVDRSNGGPEELHLISSRLIELFGDAKAANYTNTFTITLGTTTYTATNLQAMNIAVSEIQGPREINLASDLKEFRNDFNLILYA